MARPLLFDHILKVQYDNKSPLLAYPRKGTNADFEYFTARELDVLVERAAKYYQKTGLDPVQEPILSVISPSDLDYLVTQFALSRLGLGLLFLSTRLSPEACLKLMRENGSRTIIQSESSLAFKLGDRIHQADSSTKVNSLIGEDIYRDPSWDALPPLQLPTRPADERQHDTAIVYHSSGSTGLPKSIPTSHAKLLASIPPGKGSRAITTSPLFHAYASKLTINCMISGHMCMYLNNAAIPQTNDGLVELFEVAQPDVFFAVPYNLKLLAESPSGIEALRKCKQVVSSGSQLSDELGNRLVEADVSIETLFAGTEPGLVGTSMNRPAGDRAWDYIRLPLHIQQNTYYKPLGNNTFEFVFLSTLPTLNLSNSDDPPGSFHSSDIFTPHPEIPHAWKFLGRTDDRVTLSNGEKVLPLPIEGRVREEALVKDAVVFGIGRALPGLLLFRADAAADMDDEHFIDAVWPAVEAANSTSEAFSQINKDMIVCLPSGTRVPATDKTNFIRAQIYKLFADDIEQAYARLESAATPGTLVLDQQDLEKYLLQLARDQLGIDVQSTTDELYGAGLDSLRATQLRSLILRKLALGSDPARFTQGVIFQAGTLQRLASKIIALRDETAEVQESDDYEKVMTGLIEKCSQFRQHTPMASNTAGGMTVLLTGATGSLGAHLLDQLLHRDDVDKIYCLVRTSSHSHSKPDDRVRAALEARHLSTSHLESKASILTSDLAAPDLGLSPTTLAELLKTTTHIIHAAWPVNFQLSLSSFEPQLRGLHNLLNLALQSPHATPAHFYFCSSVAVALATLAPAVIPEAPISDLSQALPSGYGRSKLVAERIVAAAAETKGVPATILRIGQVVGDTRVGIWNDTEAWPLIVRSARTLGVLPRLDVTCSWLPVDTLASSILDLAIPTPTSSSTPTPTPPIPTTNLTIYNLTSPRLFHWTRDLLPLLSRTSTAPTFTAVEPAVWLAALRKYSENVETAGTGGEREGAVRRNPAVKLREYFEGMYGAGAENGEGTKTEKQEVVFSTEGAERQSRALRAAPDVLEVGLLGKFVEGWMGKWDLEDREG